MFGPHLLIYTTGLTPTDVPIRLASDARIGGAQLLGSAIGRPEAQQAGVSAAQALKAGDVLGLRTFWQVDQPFSQDFFIFVHILNQAGQTVAQRDTPPWQGRYPTSSWRAGTLVVDANDLPLPPDLAPGEYSIVVGMFDPTTGAQPQVRIDGQAAANGAVPIGKIRVTR
jgi:hypothetical protein